MIDAKRVDSSTEVWFTNPGSSTRHAYIRAHLPPSLLGGPERYVVMDDDGVIHVTDQRYMVRPTSRVILQAEGHIQTVLSVLHRNRQTDWAADCIRELEDALYELAKPEATDRTV